MVKSSAFLLLIGLMLVACRDESESTPAPKQYFVSATETSLVSAISLKQLALLIGQQQVAQHLQYDVKSYKLIYQTTFRGKTIKASGLILLPVGMRGEAPVISIQHGTTFEKSEAPSIAGGFTGMELFSSAGYISLVPDFIGYGSSADIFHPYYDKEHSALVVVDMIRAAKEFLTKEDVAYSEDLFLAGYSEGGYVTLATAHTIENDPIDDLKLKAVAAGAGGYDLKEMLKGITTTTYYSYPAYLAFVIMSYNNTYQWNKPLTYFFKTQYADALEKYMNGQYSGSTINSKLTTNLEELFNPEFYARLKSGNEPEFQKAVEANSVSGWKSDIPMKLYHGTKDEIIPYQNSEITLENFHAAGSADVTLTLITNGTHGSSFLPMMESFVPWFLELR